MNTKKLKQLVLDLAIHGKLVPQDPNDEPASELLKRIQADVETHGRASNKSKGKKSAISSVDLDEVPFEVPSSWCWTTIGELLTNRDSERKPVSSTERKKQSERIYDYYGATGVVDKVASYLFDERLLLIGEDGANLLSRAKDNAFFAEGKYWVNNHAHILDCKEKSILDYVAVVVNSMSLDDYITGSAQPKLSQDNLNKILIPLPPLAEQHRIVAAIEKWFAVIDQLEKNEADLKKSIEQTKKKVLDLAIRGKLVAQNAEDEPAGELLARIRADVETHGRASKSKKSAIPSVDLDEVPFEVPEGWCWCRLGEISIDSADGPFGSNLKKNHYTDNQEVRIVQLSNIGETTWRDDNVKYTTFEHLKNISRSEVVPGDIIIAKMMPAGRAIICPSYEKKYVLSSDAVRFTFSKHVFNKYLYYAINSSVFKSQVYDNVQGVTRVRTSLVKLREYLVPLPPLSEQKRIVEKIEEVFGVLERIEES